MPITMKLELGGLFAPGKFSTYQRLLSTNISTAVGSGMKSGGREVVDKLRRVYASSVKIRRKSFPKAIGAKLFDRKSNQLPEDRKSVV